MFMDQFDIRSFVYSFLIIIIYSFNVKLTRATFNNATTRYT